MADYQHVLAVHADISRRKKRKWADVDPQFGFRNFRICLCLEIGLKTQEAIPYCEKAISICKSIIQRLMNESQKPSASNSPVSNQSVEVSSSTPFVSAADKVDEIETLNSLLGDLERKLEDMQLLASNPTEPVLPDLMAIFAAKAKEIQKGAPR